MLKAQIHGKLSADVWQNNEDLLTSAVFGTLANLPDDVARDVFADIVMMELGQPLVLTSPIEWEFWAWWAEASAEREGCEPDVVVRGPGGMIVIEAKLWSGFGVEPDKRDQLDREWRHASRFAKSASISFSLVAVTAHLSPPWDEIRQQLRLIEELDASRVGWTSWTRIGRVLHRRTQDPRWRAIHGWVSDLEAVLELTGQAPFEGYRDIVLASARLTARLGKETASWLTDSSLLMDFGELSASATRLNRHGLAWLREGLA